MVNLVISDDFGAEHVCSDGNVWDINIINGIIWLIINRYGVWLLISGWWLTYPSEKYARQLG